VRRREPDRRPGPERRRDGGDEDRPRRQGRHRLGRRHEAGDARVRRRRRGAAVHQRGRPGARRHALRRVRLPGLTAAMRRSDQRGDAVFALYQHEVTGRPLDELLAGAKPFTLELAEGTEAHRDELDEIIAAHVQGWDPSRIAPLEKSIMRVALYEMA